MYRQIVGMLFRVKCMYRSYLVEVYDTGLDNDELAEFCAKISAKGEIITSVTRIFENRSETPRVSVLTTKTYKRYLDKELKKIKNEKTS